MTDSVIVLHRLTHFCHHPLRVFPIVGQEDRPAVSPPSAPHSQCNCDELHRAGARCFPIPGRGPEPDVFGQRAGQPLVPPPPQVEDRRRPARWNLVRKENLS